MAMVRPRSAAALATERAIDMEMERVLRGEAARYPNGSSWIPADILTDDDVREDHRCGRGVVVVDADGSERFLPAPEPREDDWDPDDPARGLVPEPPPASAVRGESGRRAPSA